MVEMDTKIKSVLRPYSKFSVPQFQNSELTIFLFLLGDGLNYGCGNATSVFTVLGFERQMIMPQVREGHFGVVILVKNTGNLNTYTFT